MKAEIRRLLRDDYESFLRKAFREDHGKALGAAPYVTWLCDGLSWLLKTDGGRLVINLPPRHGKTLFCGTYFVPWLLGRNPRLKIIVVTYSGELSEMFTYAMRRVMKADFYRQVFDTRLAPDRQKAGNFRTDCGGSVFATSTGGIAGGIGADLIILDDPLNIHDARDPEKVQELNDKFDGVLTSRLDTPSQGRILIIAHRLHENDLSAHLKGEPNTRHIAQPLVAPRRTRVRLSSGDWIRERGELLRSNSHSKATIESLRSTRFPSWGLFYQQGVETSKSKITEEHFQTYNPRLLSPGPIVISVDTAMKQGVRNSFTVVQVWGPRPNGYFLIEQVRGQCLYTECQNTVLRLSNMHRASVILIEDSINGPALIEVLQKRASTPIVPMNPGRRPKAERLESHIPLIRKGKIFLPDGFVDRQVFVDEFLGRAASTDQVDTATQMLDYMATKPVLRTQQPRSLPVLVGAKVGRIVPDQGGLPSISVPGAVLVFGRKRWQ
jgi:phage terminase large subunit-like protein